MKFAREFRRHLECEGVQGLLDYDWAERFWELGFEMDCGHSFNEKTGLLLGDERGLDRVLESIDDVRLLGDAAFSQCRYITHWAYSLEHESVEWIVRLLRRMEELADSSDAAVVGQG